MSQQDAFPNEKDEAMKNGPVLRLNDKHVRLLKAITLSKKRIKYETEAIAGDTESLADELHVKPAVINKLVSLIMAEEEKGGAIHATERVLEYADQYFHKLDTGSDDPDAEEQPLEQTLASGIAAGKIQITTSTGGDASLDKAGASPKQRKKKD